MGNAKNRTRVTRMTGEGETAQVRNVFGEEAHAPSGGTGVLSGEDYYDEIEAEQAYGAAHGAAEWYASQVNNEGLAAQIGFLRAAKWTDHDIAERLEAASADDPEELDWVLDDAVIDEASEVATSLYNDGDVPLDLMHEAVTKTIAVRAYADDAALAADPFQFNPPSFSTKFRDTADPLWKYVGAQRINDLEHREAYLRAVGDGYGTRIGTGSKSDVDKVFLACGFTDRRDDPQLYNEIASAFGVDPADLEDKPHQPNHEEYDRQLVEKATERAAISDKGFSGSGWGDHRPTRAIHDIAQMQAGDLIAVEEPTFKQRNLARITKVEPDEWGGPPTVWMKYVDPSDPSKERTPPAPELPAGWPNEFFHTGPGR